MDNLLENPSAAQRFNPRRYAYLKKRNPDAAPKTQHEDHLQRAVCQYLKMQYPKVMFRSDTSSGRWEYSQRHLAAKVIYNSSKSWPDIFVYEPRFINGVQYAGLAIELKKEGTILVLKTGPRKGHLTSNPHIQEQYLLLKELKKRGYYATFAVGFDSAQKTIDWYMGRQVKENAELPF